MEISARFHGGLGCRVSGSIASRVQSKRILGSVSFWRFKTSRLPISMCLNGNVEIPDYETRTNPSFIKDELSQQKGMDASFQLKEEKPDPGVSVPSENTSLPKKKTAKIHDFCFGIPFGGIVLGGGLVGFLFTKNPATLGAGILYGGALLALSSYSLKVWKQGKSCFPFILGQAALAAALLGKHLQLFSLTKKLFPTGIFASLSAFMLCFYSYVLISGGNPPSKKLKMAAESTTS